MKNPVLAIIMAAAAFVPFAGIASAQTAGGPSPQVIAQIEQIRSNAETTAFNDLSPAHRTQVQAIIAQANNESFEQRQSSASQIDAILTPQEAQAVLGVARNAREQIRSLMSQYRPNMENRPNGANDTNGQRPGGENRTPDAGRSLLMLARPMRQRPPQ